MILRPLRALLAFHRCGTIMAAAEEVHLSPGAVSVQLKLLEERLGAPLFERTRRSIRLTPTGYKIIPLAEKVLVAYEALLQGTSATLHGQMSLGVVNRVLPSAFPTAIKQVIANSSGIEIKVSSGTASELVTKVSAGLLDAAVVTQPPKPLDDVLVLHDLYAEPVYLVSLPMYRRGTNTVETVLRTQPYIALEHSTWAGQVIRAYLERHRINAKPVMEFNSCEAILVAVRAGLGAALLPLARDYPRDTTLWFKKVPELVCGVVMVERQIHLRAHLTAQVLASLRRVNGRDDLKSDNDRAVTARPNGQAMRKRAGAFH